MAGNDQNQLEGALLMMDYSRRYDGKWNLWRSHNQIDGDDTSRYEVVAVYDSEQEAYIALTKPTKVFYFGEDKDKVAKLLARDGLRLVDG